MAKTSKYILSAVFSVALCGMVFSQKPQTEEDVKENARELFSSGEYSSALPLYSQLLSLYPKDPNYSYRFGACKLFAEKDKEAPLTYLEFGANDPGVEPEAFFFLAKGYHLNYRFDEALSMYRKFEEKGDEKSKEKLLLARHIAMCENGKKLLKNVTDIVVLEKKNLGKTDYFRDYNLSEFGGKIIRAPDEFLLPYDVKKKKESIMYLQPNAEVVYFSSYGEDGKNGKDIYFSKKTPDGNWGTPQILPGPVNTEFDEDFPFIHPNGTLYFSSAGHNSMGGYDVFKSSFDQESQQWSYPQNIDFAISTPGDDFLYITDMEEKNAYFSSTRECNENEVTVFRVKVDRIPVDIVIIKGNFFSETTKSVKITIEDLKDGKIAGVFNTNSNNGDYVLTIPNGGKYKFLVETSENPVTYSGVVEVPRQKTLKALRQEMKLMAENGEQRLIIKNIFDEEAPGEVSVLMAEIFKEKATLEVNATDEPKPPQLPDSAKKDDAFSETQPGNANTGDTSLSAEKASAPVKPESISNEEIIKIAKEDAKSSQTEASELRLETEIAYSISTEKNRMSVEKAKEAEEFMTGALYATDPSEKQQKLDKAKLSKKESKLYAEQAVVAYNLAKEIEKNASEKQKEADIAFNYARELEVAVQQNSPEAAAEKLAQLNEYLEKQKSQPEEKTGYPDLTQKIEEKRKEADTQEKLARKLQDDVSNLESDITALKIAARTEKKKKDRERIEGQAYILEKDLPALQAEAQAAKETSLKYNQELVDLEKQESILSSVVSQIKSSDKNSVTGLTEIDKSKLGTDISTSEERIAQLEKELATETSGNEQPVVSITTKEDNEVKAQGGIPDTSRPEGKMIPDDYETHFTNKIAEINRQPDPVKIAESKTIEYNNWADALEKEASALKLKSEQVTDESEKQAIIEKSGSLENSAREKRRLAIESGEAAAQLRTAKNNETASTEGNPPENPVPADYNSYYNSKIADTEAQTDIVKKEESKARDYDNWARAMEKEADSLKQKATATADETEKALLIEKASSLEVSAREKRNLSQESQATAAQLRVSSQPASEPALSGSPVSENPVIAFYSEKYISTEKNALGIQNEKDKAITLAEINKEWANEIKNEISTLKVSADTVSDEKKKAEMNETVRLLEELKKEKEAKAQEYTEKALEVTASVPGEKTTESITPVAPAEVVINDSEIPADYSPWFENKILEQEAKSDPVGKEEAKAAYYEKWAGSIDSEVKLLKSQADTTSNEEEKQGLDEKIVKMEMMANEKREASLKSREDARNLRAASSVVSMETNPSGFNNSTQQPQANVEPEKLRQTMIEEKKYQAESYNNLIKTIETSIANSKSLREASGLENQKADLQKKVQVLNSEIEESKPLAVESDTIKPVQKVADEKLAESAVASQQADSLASEAIVMNYQADHMGFFKRKKKEEMKQKAKAAENESALKKQDSELAVFYASKISNAKADAATAYRNKETLPSELELKKSKANEDESLYLSDQAGAIRQNALNTKKKKEKKRLVAEADSLDVLAAMRKKEAMHNAILASEMKKIEKEAFIEMVAEAEKTDSPLPLVDSELNEEQVAEMKENQEQQRFTSMRKEYKKLYLESEITRENAAKMKKDAETRLSQFSTMVAGIDTIPDDTIRTQLVKDAMDFLAQTQKDIAKSDSIAVVALVKEENGRARVREALLPLMDGDPETMKKIFAFQYYKPPVDTTIPVAVADTVVKDTTPVVVAPPEVPVVKETFLVGTEAVTYNDKNPIPLNPKYPEGLVWQVQIGAFRNPIPQDLFKGFAPIMGVKVSDGITRYSAGLFKTFATANNARQQIVKFGYKDAFVVVYRNGVRIPITEARTLIAKGLIPSETFADISVTPETTISSGLPQSGSQGENQVEKISGLFFTVQIGVYSKPATEVQLKNVKPVNSEKLGNGTIRYSTGIYDNLASATEAKNKIVAIGIGDAFVTAYHNGKRITIAEANDLAGKNTAKASVPSPSSTGAGNSAAGSGTENREETGIVFRVKLGSYSEEVPLEVSGIILEFSRDDSKQEKDNSGNTVYYSGPFPDFSSAEKHKNSAVEKGLANAIVEAFNKGEKMDIDEAKKITGR